MTPSQLSELLSRDVEAVCRELLPAGRRRGHEWVIGDIDGHEGQSLQVRLDGAKAGVWADFATGEAGADLLDLWVMTRSVPLREAMQQAAGYLGITLSPEQARKPRKEYKRPGRPAAARRPVDDSPVMAYLAGRGITADTVQAFRVAETRGCGGFDGDNQGCIILPYLRDGELINIKTIALARDGRGKKQMRQAGGAEPCLYGWQALPENTRAVAITEGEIDAMSLHQCGVPALSVPNGGGGGAKQDWIETEWERLECFDVVYLALDNDEPGREASREIIKRLGAERCRICQFPEGIKDANEALQAGWRVEEFQRLIQSSRYLDPDELVPAAAFAADVWEEFEPSGGRVPGLRTPWSKIGDGIVFRPGEVTLWTGFSGHGKSQVLNHQMVAALHQGERACIASLEVPGKRTLYFMARQAAGLERPSREYFDEIFRWFDDRLWLFNVVNNCNVAKVLEVFSYAAKRYGVSQFVVDSLLRLGIREDDYDGQKGAVDSLVGFAREHQVHVHLVAHSRKGEDEFRIPSKHDVRGSSAITDLVHNGITVWRNKRKEIEMGQDDRSEGIEDMPDAKVAIWKQRSTGEEGVAALWFDSGSCQFLERSNENARRYVPFMRPVADGVSHG